MPDLTENPPESSPALKPLSSECLASQSMRRSSRSDALLQVRVGGLTRRVRRTRSVRKLPDFKNCPELGEASQTCRVRLSCTARFTPLLNRFARRQLPEFDTLRTGCSSGIDQLEIRLSSAARSRALKEGNVGSNV